MIKGFGVLLASGLCQGSFGLGYKKYTPYSWAAFWGIYNILCMLVATIAVMILAPGAVCEMFSYNLLLPVLCGGLWGLSAICFSKAIDMIGMSLVYGISMGGSTIVGSVLPLIMGGTLPKGRSAVFFWTGLLVTLIGIVIITIAGIKRDGAVKASMTGIIMTILSGLGSGAMNIGFLRSDELGAFLTDMGYSQAGISATKWLPVLVGGCLAGLIWCICEVTVRKDWHTITEAGSAKRLVILAGVSLIWYAALLLYGLAVYMLGDLGETVGWILFQALALIVSLFWGIVSGEWKNHSKKLLFAGCVVLICAWGLISMK